MTLKAKCVKDQTHPLPLVGLPPPSHPEKRSKCHHYKLCIDHKSLNSMTLSWRCLFPDGDAYTKQFAWRVATVKAQLCSELAGLTHLNPVNGPCVCDKTRRRWASSGSATGIITCEGMSSDAQQPLDEVTSFCFTHSNTHTHTLLWALLTVFGLSVSTPADGGIITSLNNNKRKRYVYYAIFEEKYMGTMQCIVTNVCIIVQRISFSSKRTNIAATMYWCQRQMLVLYFVHSNIGNIWPLKCVCLLCVCVFKSCKIVYGCDEQVAAWKNSVVTCNES